MQFSPSIHSIRSDYANLKNKLNDAQSEWAARDDLAIPSVAQRTQPPPQRLPFPLAPPTTTPPHTTTELRRWIYRCRDGVMARVTMWPVVGWLCHRWLALTDTPFFQFLRRHSPAANFLFFHCNLLCLAEKGQFS